MPMTLAQARKMVKGTLKGNSAMAKAIKELVSGQAAEEPIPADDEMAGSRGEHTAASWNAKEAGGW